ncbi:hypothetical protein [Azoarcus sp. DN11]|uniref:hypothetical protein n=1 Tax=Azoarcus sp. DN11 TaxID=356837 RepID=UPI000FE22A0D|nr:hypothetical protein [Azoarcus sp. DN11]
MAQADADLRRQLEVHFGTSELSAPDKSPLVSATANVMTWVIQGARSMYRVAQPEILVAAISSSTKANALAVWSSSGRDWIVFSEGLMVLLCDQMDCVAARFAATFPDLMNTKLMQRLLAESPLPGGFTNALSSFLYFAAVAFFTGHEAGHHLAGHATQYPKHAHAEDSESGAIDTGGEWLIGHALERDADLLGLTLCRIAMIRLLSKLWGVEEAENLSADKRQIFQCVLAAMISTGALTAAVFIKPKSIDWDNVPNGTHSPAVARLLTLATSISDAIKKNFHDLDPIYRRWIRLMSLEVAVGASIKPGTDADRLQQERSARGGEPAAIRATGIRKALYDPTFRKYTAQLNATIKEIRPRLKPRR